MQSSTSKASSLDGRELVLVTGGTGFIAAWTIKLLLAEGFRVRATVRDLKSKKSAFLRSLPGAVTLLELVATDLLSPKGWDEAVKGCTYVQHIASPYSFKINDAQKDLVDPAVNGTLFVLNACLEEASIKKVVLTSTLLAVSDSFDRPEQYGPDDWNTTSSLTRNPYAYSKVLAERAAHQFMKEKRPGFELAVINPFAVIGPSIDTSSPVNESVDIIYGYMQGKVPFSLPGAIAFVDVRDVVLANVLAMKSARAIGGKRYLLTSGNATGLELAEVIREVLPHDQHSKLPSKDLPWWFPKWLLLTIVRLTDSRDKATFLGTMWGAVPNIDVSSSQQDLGVNFTDWRKSVRDTVDWLQNEYSPAA